MENNEDYIIKMPSVKGNINPNGVGCYCYEMMTLHKDKIAQICTETGQEDTYEELLKRSIRTAIKMKDKGIKSSDIISMCTYNHLNSMVPSIAAQFLCCKVASFDPTLPQEDTNRLMGIIKPRLIFVIPEALELIEEAIRSAGGDTEIVVFGNSSKYESFDEYLQESNEEKDFRPTPVKSLQETAYIFFSSGTTGLPKGICFTQYQTLILQQFNQITTTANDNFLSYSSPYWVSAIIFFITALSQGGTRLIAKVFDAEKFWLILKKYKIFMLFTPTNQIFDILNVKPKDVDTSTLKYLVIGGTTLSKDQFIFLGNEFPNTLVYSGYGLTEAGLVTMIDPNTSKDVMLKKAGSCGTPVDGIWYKLIDADTGKILGPNKVGELWVKSKAMMGGYFNMDSSDRFDKDGYLSTGDLLYYDEDHYFYYVDRIKEMFKYKSWHVQPASIESVIVQHLSVLRVVVVGLPHPIDGDHPIAFVVLKNGYENTTSEEIKQFANAKLHDRQQLRGGLRIVNQIPLTPTGKINRRKVRELVLKNGVSTNLHNTYKSV